MNENQPTKEIKINKMTESYLDWQLEHSLWLFEETRKRIKYCPFETAAFEYLLVPDITPHFFVVRHLLSEAGINYKIVETPGPEEGRDFLVVTAHTTHDSRFTVKVRGQNRALTDMPLYVEAGNWDVPQCNPVFDWSHEQAWAYMVHVGLINKEEVCSTTM